VKAYLASKMVMAEPKDWKDWCDEESVTGVPRSPITGKFMGDNKPGYVIIIPVANGGFRKGWMDKEQFDKEYREVQENEIQVLYTQCAKEN